MIVLDTHIWVWWVTLSPRLTQQQRGWINIYQSSGLGVSIFSVWEVTKLVVKGRITLSISINEWLKMALSYPGVQLLPLTIPIIIESNQLIGFHNDPADQIIVATAKIHGCPLLTADGKILKYSDCNTLN